MDSKDTKKMALEVTKKKTMELSHEQKMMLIKKANEKMWSESRHSPIDTGA